MLSLYATCKSRWYIEAIEPFAAKLAESCPMLPLINFNASYYTYPVSICRGHWGRYPLDMDLSVDDRKRRIEWLHDVRRLSGTPLHEHVFSKYGQIADDALFIDILQRHGIFVEKFFHRALRHRVLGEIVADPKELGNLKVLFDTARGHQTAFGQKVADDVFFVVDHIFEQHLYRAINDQANYNILAEWYKRHSQPRQCEVCGSVYRLVDLPDWIYAGSNGTQICCMQCRIVKRASKKAILPYLREFVNACGFIPSSNATPISYSFTIRLSPQQWPSVFAAYGKMGGVDHVKAKWDSWFKALASSGVLPDGVMVTSRGIRCLAKDGHECHSLDEQQIDNWLSEHNLTHEREPIYPPHQILNPHGKRRADWRVGTVYIEYFGLAGEKAYDNKTDEKIMLARQLGITMVPVYPSDMISLDKVLWRLLRKDWA